MSSQRVLGLVLLVVGLILLVFGLNATDSIADTVKEDFTGRFTDKTMWYLIGGAAAALCGLAMTFFGAGRKLSH
jgi:uncharacterized membrane protein